MPEESKNTGKQDSESKQEKKVEKLQADIAAKKKEIAEAERKAEIELFREHGYKILSDLKYDGEILSAGTRDRLGKLNKEELQRLAAEGIISK